MRLNNVYVPGLVFLDNTFVLRRDASFLSAKAAVNELSTS